MRNFILILLFSIASLAVDAQTGMMEIGIDIKLQKVKKVSQPVILGVEPNSIAANAGLQKGDFIMEIDGKSMRDVAMYDVLNKLIREKGTPMTMVVDRAGTQHTLNMVRAGTLEAHEPQPGNADLTGETNALDFCGAVVRLVNDAPSNFATTQDKNQAVGDGFASNVKLPGAKSVKMEKSMLTTECKVDFGQFTSQAAVDAERVRLLKQLETCLPEYYQNAVHISDGNDIVEFGRTTNTGYEAPVIQLSSFYAEPLKAYLLKMYISGGDRIQYETIQGAPASDVYATDILGIFNDIPNKFKTVLETKKVPEGARVAALYAPLGQRDLGYKCNYYDGNNRDDAVAAYDAVVNATRNAVGSKFVFTKSDKRPELNFSISPNAEAVTIFGIKQQRGTDKVPQIVVVRTKDSEGNYIVNLLFLTALL